MTTYGYIRPSLLNDLSDEVKRGFLSPQKQQELLCNYGVDHCFIEASPPFENKTQTLDETLEKMKPGDILIVAQLHRLGRDIDQLGAFFKEQDERGIRIISLDQPPVENNITTPITYCTWFLEQEKLVRKERFYVGMRRVHKLRNYGGRKPKINPKLIEQIRYQLSTGKPKTVVAKELEISRATMYKAIDQIQTEIEEKKNSVSA